MPFQDIGRSSHHGIGTLHCQTNAWPRSERCHSRLPCVSSCSLIVWSARLSGTGPGQKVTLFLPAPFVKNKGSFLCGCQSRKLDHTELDPARGVYWHQQIWRLHSAAERSAMKSQKKGGTHISRSNFAEIALQRDRGPVSFQVNFSVPTALFPLVDSPFFSALVLFRKQPVFIPGCWRFSRKLRIPKNGNGSYPQTLRRKSHPPRWFPPLPAASQAPGWSPKTGRAAAGPRGRWAPGRPPAACRRSCRCPWPYS